MPPAVRNHSEVGENREGVRSQPWKSQLTSLSLSFLTCKRKESDQKMFELSSNNMNILKPGKRRLGVSLWNHGILEMSDFNTYPQINGIYVWTRAPSIYANIKMLLPVLRLFCFSLPTSSMNIWRFNSFCWSLLWYIEGQVSDSFCQEEPLNYLTDFFQDLF